MLTNEQMLSAYRPIGGEYRLRVGFEYEVQLLSGEDLRPLGYAELLAVLDEAARITGGQPDDNAGGSAVRNKLDLGGGRLLSLEPGGQFEYSSAPVETFAACIDQVAFFCDLLRQLHATLGVHVFYGGLNPVHTVDQIGLVIANERYRSMDEYFPRVGSMGRRMMRQSCSVQVTFDYQNPDLGVELVRTAARVSPLAAGLFCNAPFVDGAASGYRSYRPVVWDNTDPARSGLPEAFCRDGFDFESYLAYVLEAPMFFVQTPGGLIDAGGMTFAQFNQRGFRAPGAEGSLVFPSFSDFEQHNSTIFTDVRLKRTVELRSIDGQDPKMVPSAIALVCGLLLCSQARQRSQSLLAQLSPRELSRLSLELGRAGLTGTTGGRPTHELMLDLIDTAAEGLRSCFADGDEAARHLEPVRALATQAKTPADVVLDQFADAQAWLRAGRTFQ